MHHINLHSLCSCVDAVSEVEVEPLNGKVHLHLNDVNTPDRFITCPLYQCFQPWSSWSLRTRAEKVNDLNMQSVRYLLYVS